MSSGSLYSRRELVGALGENANHLQYRPHLERKERGTPTKIGGVEGATPWLNLSYQRQ